MTAPTRLSIVPEWQERGLCRQVDPDLFFPEHGNSAEPAKSICRRCDVRTECRQWALDTGEQYGVWGGMSEPERRQVFRARKQQEVAA